MNYVDLAVLGILGISALLGLSRGLVREVLGIGAWALAGWGAWQFGPLAIPLARRSIESPDLADAAAYAGTFVLLVIMASLASNLVGRIVQVSALGGLDRTLGLVFGMARGGAVVVAGYVLVGLLFPRADAWPDALRDSRLLPLAYDGAAWTVAQLPEAYRPAVHPPPEGRKPSSEDFYQRTPEGRALGPRPSRN